MGEVIRLSSVGVDAAGAEKERVVLRDAVGDMSGWIERLPAGSDWAPAFLLARREILSVLEGA